MRSYPELRQILELWEQGMTKQGISEKTGIPRRTVIDSINRYQTVNKLDAIIQGKNNFAQDSELYTNFGEKRYILPGFISRKQRYTDDELREAIAAAFSLAEVLQKLNLRPAGGNYDLLKRRIAALGLNTAHFTGKAWLRGKRNPNALRRDMAEILIKDSTYVSTQHLKERLLAEGIFQHCCASCGLTEWLERPIPLEIDHINGDRRDNRLENLRLLCPNCHALTVTYRGKNKRAITVSTP